MQSSPYLRTLGEQLHESIDVFWTGARIIADTFTESHLSAITTVLRRQPLLWDNLFANDYDMRRVYIGPYNRDIAISQHVKGILLNPNCEFALNYVPLHTMAAFARCSNATIAYHRNDAYISAIHDWWAATLTLQEQQLISESEFRMLCDCFYLPYDNGAFADTFISDMQYLLSTYAPGWDQSVFQRFCESCQLLVSLFERLTAIQNRYYVHGNIYAQ